MSEREQLRYSTDDGILPYHAKPNGKQLRNTFRVTVKTFYCLNSSPVLLVPITTLQRDLRDVSLSQAIDSP